MGEVISLKAHRAQREVEAHARALVLFECAANLARAENPGLVRLIDQVFGAGWLEARVQATVSPRKVVEQLDPPVKPSRQPAR